MEMRRHNARGRGVTLAGIALCIVLGVCIGEASYTFHYAEGLSYFSPDPKSCVNCHIMQSQYDGWQKASHHNVATCVDCHLPHTFPAKYIVKAENGYFHSKGFTFQDFAEPIRMRPQSQRVLERNCLYCHADLVHDILSTGREEDQVGCIHCHRTVGHGDGVGLGKFEPVSPELLKTIGPQHASE